MTHRVLGRSADGSDNGSDNGSDDGSDDVLLAAARAGDREAFGRLWRRHERAAYACARSLTRRPSDADELVSEATVKVLQALHAGGGPRAGFRPYLLTAIRRTAVDIARKQGRIELTDDVGTLDRAASITPLGEMTAADDRALAGYEHRITWAAWKSLDDDSRQILWLGLVDELRPAQLAAHLGVSTNAAAIRLSRARERLRQAYLQAHVAAASDDDCRWAREQLGAYLRDGLPPRTRKAVRAHLDSCAECTSARDQVGDVAPALRRSLPLLLLGPAAGGAYRLRTPRTWHLRVPTHPAAAAAGIAVTAAVLSASAAMGHRASEDIAMKSAHRDAAQTSSTTSPGRTPVSRPAARTTGRVATHASPSPGGSATAPAGAPASGAGAAAGSPSGAPSSPAPTGTASVNVPAPAGTAAPSLAPTMAPAAGPSSTTAPRPRIAVTISVSAPKPTTCTVTTHGRPGCT